jgi:hypothetical protein
MSDTCTGCGARNAEHHVLGAIDGLVPGAWGFGTNVYFADNVSLLVGPVFFFDKNLQPGGTRYMWTAQLDVDIPLGR